MKVKALLVLAIIILAALLLVSVLVNWYQHSDIQGKSTANYFLRYQRDACMLEKKVLKDKIKIYKIDSTYGNIKQEYKGAD